MVEDKILMTARYVEGDLNEQEFADFELRLKDDEELQKHLIDYNHIHQSLKMQLGNDTAFLETLQANNKQFFSNETKVFKLHPILKWATGIAAVLFIGIFVWAPWRDNLYHKYNENQKMMVAERGASSTPLDKAASLFNQQKYSEANAIFEQLYAKDPNNVMVGYYYGLSLTEVNQTDKARKLLTEIYNGQSVYKYEACYAIALTYLKDKNKREAKSWLLKISANTNIYQKAQLLIKQIE